MTTKPTGELDELVRGNARVGGIALLCAVLGAAWYLIAEFVLWHAERARGEQPPDWAVAPLLLLTFVALLAGLMGLLLGLLVRRPTRARPAAGSQGAGPGLGFSLAALVILGALWFVVIPSAE